MTQFKKGDPVWVAGFVDDPGNTASVVDVIVHLGGFQQALVRNKAIHPRTDDAPRATSPVHVVKLEATRRTVRTPENDGGLYSEESEDNEITLVTAAGHRLELAPWVVDALRMELTR